MGEFQAEGGGVHPGKPIIWPTGKASASSSSSSSQAASRSQQAQTTGSARNVPTQTAPTTAAQKSASAAPAQAAAAPVSAPKQAATVARALTVEDVRSHMLSMQIEPNDFNTKLASLMLRSGIELSRANFVKMLTMLQGSNKSQSMQEAAALLLTKGLDSPEAAKILGQYLEQNPAMASQLSGLQQNISSLLTAIGQGKALLDPTLFSQLSALLSQFESSLGELSGKFFGKTLSGQGPLLGDLRALKALLQGLKEKTSGGGAKAEELSAQLTKAQENLKGITENLIAQAILSQKGRYEVNYHYQQVPNAMTNPPKDFEIIVKRDSEGKEALIDPRNTQVIMSFETEKMGKMVVSMIVKEGKVYLIFVFAEKEYGDQGRALIAKEFSDLQKNLSEKNFMITGYQVKVDPVMCQTRAFMFPFLDLENELRRVDLEA